MPDQPNLTDKQIGGIVAYIKTESAKVAAQNTAPFAKPSRIRPTYLPVSFTHNWGFIIAYIVSVSKLYNTILLWGRSNL